MDRSASLFFDEIPLILSELVTIGNTTGAEMEIAKFIAAKTKEWAFETELIPEPLPERPQVVVYHG